MSTSRIEGAHKFNGAVEFTNISVQASAFGNTEIDESDPITAAKLQHQHQPCYFQTGTAAAATIPLHHAYGDGTIVAIKAGTIAACTGNATITIDVKKNGTTVLSSTIVLDNANTARVAEAGTLNVTSYSGGDLLEVVVTVNAGSGALGTGLFVEAILREDANP